MIGGRAIIEVGALLLVVGVVFGSGYHWGKQAGASSRDDEVAARTLERDNARRERDTARTERDQQAGALQALALAADKHGTELVQKAARAGQIARQDAQAIMEVLRDVPTQPAAPGEPECKRTEDLLRRYVDAARRLRNPAADSASADPAPHPRAVLVDTGEAAAPADDGIPRR